MAQVAELWQGRYWIRALKRLFAHLKDVRAWGPQDRVRTADVAAALEGMLPGDHTIEIELWYRQSDAARRRAEAEVTTLVEQGVGHVVATAQVAEVGYHGMKCSVPLELLQRLAAGDYDAVAAVKSAHVMYLRVSAQSYIFSEESQAASVGLAPRSRSLTRPLCARWSSDREPPTPRGPHHRERP